MGMDAVEIVMEVEEVFDITLDDAEAEKMLTPRDLIESVFSKVSRANSAGCLTQRAFNALRKSLLRHLSLKRRDIAPSVPLANLVPKDRRESLIENLAADLGTGPLPKLGRPTWLVALLSTFSVAVGLASVIALYQYRPGVDGGFVFFIGGSVAAITAFFAWAASNRSATSFPPMIATVGDLARWVLAHKTDLATPIAGRWTREQVAARVREIVIENLDCAANYREDASFIHDLGLS